MQCMVLVLSVKILLKGSPKSTRLHLRTSIFQAFPGENAPRSPLEFFKTLLFPPKFLEHAIALNFQQERGQQLSGVGIPVVLNDI